MNDVQRGLFRFFMSAQICSPELANEVLGELNGASEEEDTNLNDCLERINKIIKQYDLEIIQGRSEVTGAEAISLVQICESSVAESAKLTDKKSSLLFSKIISTIVLSKTGAISDIEAVNLSTTADMTKTAAQAAVNAYIAQKWLEEESGRVYLGVRTILELGQLLASNYPAAVKQCILCRNNLFHGTACTQCKSNVHFHCLKKFFGRSRSCPSCQAEWTAAIPARNAAATTSGRVPSRPKRPRLISSSESD